jgi:glycosyltransferase involved in cell wall biosynthesis
VPSGTLAYIAGLAKSLGKKGIDVTLISTQIEEEDLKNFNIKCIPLKMRKADSIDFLLKLFAKIPFLKLSKNSIIHAHRPDIMLPFILFFRRHPKVCTLHGIPNISIRTRKNILIWGIYDSIEKWSLTRIDMLIAVNQSTRDYYLKKERDLEDRILVVPVGVDTSVFKPLDRNKLRKKYGFSQDEPLVLYIGRFSIEKGLYLLLEAFKTLRSEMPKVRLILVGGGPEEKRLRGMVKTQNIEGVTFMKPTAHEKIPEIINCADTLVLCSKFEGMPTVVLEALACGVPVVSTDVGGVNKVVMDGKTGQLIKEANNKSVKKAILKVIREGTDTYRDNCITVAKNYSWDTISNEIMKVYYKTAKAISGKKGRK